MQLGTATMFMPALILLVLSTLGMGWLMFHPRQDDDRLLVIFSPHDLADSMVSKVVRTGGVVLGRGALPYSLIIKSSGPDTVSELYHEGAWLVLTAAGYGGCLRNNNLNNKRGI